MTRQTTRRSQARSKSPARRAAKATTAARPRKATRKSSAKRPAKRLTKRPATSAKAARTTTTRWSQRVTQTSDALDLRHGVFTLKDPKRIAASLKRSAEQSKRRKTSAFRSALSMLTFYINRAGRSLPQAQRTRLERAKDELRRQFGR